MLASFRFVDLRLNWNLIVLNHSGIWQIQNCTMTRLAMLIYVSGWKVKNDFQTKAAFISLTSNKSATGWNCSHALTNNF
jgi:hypothetical protein